MAIDYQNLVDNIYGGSVATETAYQSPGDFKLPLLPDAPRARLLTMIEIFRSYLSQVEVVSEGRLVFILMQKMMAKMRFGYTFPPDVGTRAQFDCLSYIGGRYSEGFASLVDENGDEMITEDGKNLVW